MVILYVVEGILGYLLLGLVFVGTEVRWGFPFRYDSIGFSEPTRRSFAKDILSEKPIRNILYAPMYMLSYLVRLAIGGIFSALLLSVFAIWDFFSNGFSFKSAN